MFSLFKSNSQDFFFGEYEKPDLLQKLEEYQNIRGQTWEWLGFYIEYDHHHSMTPLDVIPFAGTGGDGIHFGFLTDFGTVKDLSNAPIVCVSPSNDPPIRLVAQNLTDFLGLVLTIGEAEFLDDDYTSDEQIKAQLQEWDEVSEVDWKGNPLPKTEIEEMKQRRAERRQGRVLLAKVLSEQFEIYPITKVSQYINDLRVVRKKEITIETLDGIGIKYRTEKLIIEGFDYSVEDNLVQSYLDKASEAERLKFYRDATYNYILSDDFDKVIKELLIKSLQKHGYRREGQILKKKY
ncbi:hypothetical protein [Roseivirga sp. 4D4]|uniref:hypothetical protein n=1 Tax=Roseivirga sp. 4D4 TaxID=1889784 RepID=UPI001112D85A|nr:hypothetical protein [Roseivirga sp. 4D4]